jgi:predicted Zn finger-like uncharacterized protein
MAQIVTCPSCSTELRIPDEMLGRKVRCSQCSKAFLPGDDRQPEPASANRQRDPDRKFEPGRRRRRERDDYDDYPRRSQKSGSGMTWLAVVGGMVLLGVLVCGGLGFFIYKRMKPENNPSVTMANFQRVEVGMTLNQVEFILGPGRAPREFEMDALPDDEDQKNQDIVAALDDADAAGQLYRWRNGNEGIWIIFTQDPHTGGKVEYIAFITINGQKMNIVSKGNLPGLAIEDNPPPPK